MMQRSPHTFCQDAPKPWDHRDRSDARQVPLEDFRQLRHQTKNALQYLLTTIQAAPELQGGGGSAIIERLQERVLAAARLSDVLFGIVSAPGPMSERLRRLSAATIALMADHPAGIGLDLEVDDRCPAVMHNVLVRVAHELVSNALKHGLRQRRNGKIALRLRLGASAVQLDVCDDGVGLGDTPQIAGEGLSLVDLLLLPHGGAFRLARDGNGTVARVTIPHPTATAARIPSHGRALERLES